MYMYTLLHHRPNEFSLFVNEQLQDFVSSALPGFSLNLPTIAPVGVVDPVLLVGGVPSFLGAKTYPSFVGCLKDLTFDLR